ncbi:MAG: GDSL-type esterase/lipase family protein [Pseudomonadota bacterium]
MISPDTIPTAFLTIASFAALSMVFFAWGMLTIKNQIFPYQLIQSFIGEKNNRKMILAKARGFDLFSLPVDVTFIGDSITEAAQWHDMFPSKRIANRGIASDTTKGILARMDGILATTPKKAFIMVGFNDLNTGEQVEQVFDRYCEIVNRLRETQIPVVMQSTIECSVRLHRVRDKIRRLNDKLQAFAAANGHQWIDLNEKLASPDRGLNEAYTYDGVHLNGDGYRQWYEVIKDAVLAVEAGDDGQTVSAVEASPGIAPPDRPSSPIDPAANAAMADANGHSRRQAS